MLTVALAAVKRVTETGEEVAGGLSEQIAGFFQYIIGRVPSWIAGFLVFVLTIFVAKLAKSAVESRISSQVDEEHQDILILSGRVTYYGTLIFGITIALKIAGMDLTPLLAAIAFGVGFALRDLIMNFLSGVFILVSRQFTIGDFIKVGDTVGKVMEIQTRATILKAIDGTKVIVPNAELFTSQVVSFTSNPLRRVIVPLYVSYDTDLKYAMKIAVEVLKKHPKILKKPPPSVIVKDYGDATIDLAARFWVGSRDGWFKVRSEIMHQMWDEFQAAGIVVPYNVMHLETEQDTGPYWKEMDEKAKKKMDEMKLSKAMEISNGNGQGKAASGAAIANLTPAPAVAEMPLDPPGVYQDQEEIDGIA